VRALLRLAGTVAVAAALFSATPARADDVKKACTDAYAQSQTLRDARRLKAAREQLRTCSRPACPAFIVADCAGWLDAVEKSLPTVVLSAKDGAGRDLLDVRVAVDGQPLVTKLDGHAVEMDPGPHAFRFDLADGTTATQQALVKEGDRNLVVSTILGAPAAAPPASALAARAGEPSLVDPVAFVASGAPALSSGGGRRVLGLVVGGVGVAGLAAGAIAGVAASSTWNTAKGECPSHAQCTPQAVRDQSSASTLATTSTIAFVAGGALVVVGVTLFLTAPRDTAPAVGLVVGPGSAGLAGSF
jgi:hypothetical protein